MKVSSLSEVLRVGASCIVYFVKMIAAVLVESGIQRIIGRANAAQVFVDEEVQRAVADVVGQRSAFGLECSAVVRETFSVMVESEDGE